MNCNKIVYNGKARNQVAVNKNWFAVCLQYKKFFLQMITKLVVCDEKLIISRMIPV